MAAGKRKGVLKSSYRVEQVILMCQNPPRPRSWRKTTKEDQKGGLTGIVLYVYLRSDLNSENQIWRRNIPKSSSGNRTRVLFTPMVSVRSFKFSPPGRTGLDIGDIDIPRAPRSLRKVKAPSLMRLTVYFSGSQASFSNLEKSEALPREDRLKSNRSSRKKYTSPPNFQR